MAGEITWMIIAVANAGKDAELDALARRATAWAKGNEPGVLEYAWRHSSESGACAIHVKIASPEATRAHLANFEQRFLKHLLDCVTIQHTLVFSDPPPAIRRKLEALDPVYLKDTSAFVRKTASGPSLIQ